MSADNGTYILETTDGFRVAQIHAIENLESNPHNVFCAFSEKICWDTLEKAVKYALVLEEKNHTEYGIHTLRYSKTWKEITEWASRYSL